MTSKELKQILQALIEYQVSELSLETPDYKLSVKRGQVLLAQAPDSKIPVVHAPAVQITPQAQPAGQNHPPVSAETAQAAAEKEKLEEVRAPIVGTFFRSPSPEAEAFVAAFQRDFAAGSELVLSVDGEGQLRAVQDGVTLGEWRNAELAEAVWRVALGERSELPNRINMARRDHLEKAESEPAEAG